jgi:hypothetical protein
LSIPRVTANTMAESTKLDTALARFDAAADKLEAALRRGARAAMSAGGEVDPAERARLLDEIAQLQSENETLRQRNEELERRNAEATLRVEAAMDKIRMALGDSA